MTPVSLRKRSQAEFDQFTVLRKAKCFCKPVSVSVLEREEACLDVVLVELLESVAESKDAAEEEVVYSLELYQVELPVPQLFRREQHVQTESIQSYRHRCQQKLNTARPNQEFVINKINNFHRNQLPI